MEPCHHFKRRRLRKVFPLDTVNREEERNRKHLFMNSALKYLHFDFAVNEKNDTFVH